MSIDFIQMNKSQVINLAVSLWPPNKPGYLPEKPLKHVGFGGAHGTNSNLTTPLHPARKMRPAKTGTFSTARQSQLSIEALARVIIFETWS